MKPGIIAFVLALILPAVSFAAHPLITDDTGTQGRGQSQIEINGEYGYDRENQDGVTTKGTGGEVAATISYGITDTMDLVYSLPYQWSEVKEDDEVTQREDGIADMSLELKWRLYEQGGLSFAVKPGITLPAGNEERGLGAGRVTYGLCFIATREIEPWTFHLNLGYSRNENKLDEREDLWHASLAAEFVIGKGLKAVANIGAEENPDRASRTSPAFILGGLIYSLSENFDLDWGVKKGLNGPETDYTVLVGTAYRF